MIVDLNALRAGTAIGGDVCVVGCGAVGMAIAGALSRHPLSIVVVDGGSGDDEPATQALYECEVTGLPFTGGISGRFRVLGGSTTRWGGQALPMDAIDFERRDWVAHSGWPIRFEELAPYYARAADYMNIDAGDYDADLARRLGAVVPPLDPGLLRFHFSKWAPRPSLREMHLSQLQRMSNVRVLTHANVTRIDLANAYRTVKSLEVRSLQGAAATIATRYFVLCTGGIENARLLLSNDHQQPAGIGNERGLVGRYFQDHPTARVASIEAADPRRFQRAFNLFYARGRKYAVRLSATEQFQRAARTLNASSGISFQAPPDSALSAVKRACRGLRGGGGWRALSREWDSIAASAPSLLQPAYAYLVCRRQYVPGAEYIVHVVSEQEPHADSRVSLADAVDALGVRKARVDWRLLPSTARCIRLFSHALRSEFVRLGMGELRLAPWLHAEDSDWRSHVKEAYHHIGTTRMSTDPCAGVVDPRCRVHGLDNLYVAGCSVFPTGGHSNPTFTALALAFRTCDELRRRLRHECSAPA